MLEKTELAQGMSLQLADQYCVNRGSMSEEKFLRKLSESGALEKCKKSEEESPSETLPEPQMPAVQKKRKPNGLIAAALASLVLLSAAVLFLRKPKPEGVTNEDRAPVPSSATETVAPQEATTPVETAASVEAPLFVGKTASTAYIYSDDNGLPKYWLDFTGSFADNPALHCYFFTDSWYESIYILDGHSAAANAHQDTYRIENVKDVRGFDVSNWFKTLTLVLNDGSARLYVERDPSTLAGGPDSTILDGLYEMTPADTGIVYELVEDKHLKSWLVLNDRNAALHFSDGRIWYLDTEASGDNTMNVTKIVSAEGNEIPFQSFVLSTLHEAVLVKADVDEMFTGSFLYNPRVFLQRDDCSGEELGRMAQMYYYRHTDFYPPEADAVQNDDGTWSVHLYEKVNNKDGTFHTATSAWYTVDASGIGTDDITGSSVDLRM